MYGKPYHKMPTSSWMIPGGNRDQKRKLMKEQKYPMMSAIQKNLGGPLSEVFFSCLTPTQQDHVGYTPKLKGPGRDLWVTPSNILSGKIVLTPRPQSTGLLQAFTHQTIMELGADIEARFLKKHTLELEEALLAKEREMKKEIDKIIKNAIEADRRAQQKINDQILEKASTDLAKSYQETLVTSVNLVLEEGLKRLEEAVEKTKREMNEELCLAVNSRSDYLCKQFDFQLAWRESELIEKYENRMKRHRQNCTEAMEKAQRRFEKELKAQVAQLEAQHITDLLIQGAERSENYHVDKQEMEHGFKNWFIKHFEDEIIKRDFALLECENQIRDLMGKFERRQDQLEKILNHFQKFINFALKEKPGQAEFLLSVQQEIKTQKEKGKEGEVEQIAKILLDYLLKIVEDTSNEKKVLQQSKEILLEFTPENFRQKLLLEKENMRKLQLVGEKRSANLSTSNFKKSQLKSLAETFQKNPSILPLLVNTKSIKESEEKIC